MLLSENCTWKFRNSSSQKWALQKALRFYLDFKMFVSYETGKKMKDIFLKSTIMVGNFKTSWFLSLLTIFVFGLEEREFTLFYFWMPVNVLGVLLPLAKTNLIWAGIRLRDMSNTFVFEQRNHFNPKKFTEILQISFWISSMRCIEDIPHTKVQRDLEVCS